MEVGLWLKGGRRSQADQMPLLNNIEDFGTSWNSWWRAMQPSWRGEALLRDAPVKDDWRPLFCGGANGLLVVIVALAWWIQAISSDSGSDWSHIEAAVDEVGWAVVQLRTALIGDVSNSIGKKRLHESDTSQLPTAKK